MSIENNELPQNPSIESETVRPFRRFCTTIMTIGSLPSSYQNAMSYQEMLLWLCDFIENKVIPAFDNNANAITELQNLYVELKSYVDNYFTSLDVQEEINKKLDEMATDGTFYNLINNKIFTDFNNELNTLNNKINNFNNNLSINKIDKNGVEQVQYQNLSQEIKEKFTGGNVAVVGENSVSTSNIVNNSITPNKLSFITLLNKIDITKLTYNKYKSNNIDHDQKGFVYTDYIPVDSNITYFAEKLRFADFYTEEKTFISGFSITGGLPENSTFNVPENAKYMIMSYSITEYPNNFLINYNDLYLYKNIGQFLLNDNININILESSNKNGFNGMLNSLKNTLYKLLLEDGSLQDNISCFTTPILPVNSNDTLLLEPPLTAIFFDKNLNIIQFINNSSVVNRDNTIEIPENAQYFQGSFNINNIDNIAIIHKSFINLLENYFPMQQDFSGYINILANIDGYYLNPDNSLVVSEPMFTTPYIKIQNYNMLYTNNVRMYAFYDSDFNILDYQSIPETYTGSIKKPTNAIYFRASYNKNFKETTYVTNNLNNIISEDTSNNNCFAFVKNITIPINTDFKIYLDNIIPFNSNLSKFNYNYNGDISHFEIDEDNFIITLNSSTICNEKLTLSLYNENGNLTKSIECNINFINPNYKNLTGLVIGDSTIAQKFETNDLLNLFNNHSTTLTLIGTQSDNSNLLNKYEGYAGVTANQFANSPTLTYDAINPFYNNGKFDFSYYMNKYKYNNLDFVIIQLGINDLFASSSNEYNSNINIATSLKNNLDIIINSIKEYNSNINIFINLIIPPNSNLQAFNNAYKNQKMYWIYKLATVTANMYLIENLNNVNIIPINLQLNTKSEIRDGVHPNENGYNTIANTIYPYLLI